jgi:acylpyruvate hydrolase
MKLATLRLDGTTAAVRVEGTTAIQTAFAEVGELLREGDVASVGSAHGTEYDLSTADLAPVVPKPGKIVCVGLNYRNHILEMGRELPRHPTLFTKYPESLIGPNGLRQSVADLDVADSTEVILPRCGAGPAFLRADRSRTPRTSPRPPPRAR